MLYIFLLVREWNTEYDEVTEAVVAAASEVRARELAAAAHLAENENVWYRPDTTVARLGTAQPGEKTLDVISWVYDRIGIRRPDLRGGVIRFAAVFPAVLVPGEERQ